MPVCINFLKLTWKSISEVFWNLRYKYVHVLPGYCLNFFFVPVLSKPTYINTCKGKMQNHMYASLNSHVYIHVYIPGNHKCTRKACK